MSTLMRRDPRTMLPDLIEWFEEPFVTLRPYLGQPIRIEDFIEGDHYMVRAELAGIDPEKDVEITVGAGSERLLRVEVRGARLHRLAAPGTARHRRPRGHRPPGRHQDQHRPQRAGPHGPDRPGALPGADGGRVRAVAADHPGQGGRDHLPRRGRGQGPHPGRPGRLRLRRPDPDRAHPLLRRDGAAREATAAGDGMSMDDDVDVLIVGAGLSGIGAAHHLQDAFPGRTYTILEARDAIGGTWDLFRYPGVRSDSDMFTLGYDFRPWTEAKAIADGPSILQYVRDTASEAGIERHIRFGHKVVRAAWSTPEARWTVTAEHDGREVTFTARFL